MLKFVMLLGLLVLPLQSIQAETIVRTGDAVSVAANQKVDGNYYAIGGTVSLSGVIAGDALLAGGNITINGTIAEDVFALGGTVNVSASTSDDVRIIGGDVTVSGPVGGSLIIVGGRVTVLSSATIRGDVLVYGGDVTIDGAVGGSVLGTVERLRVNAPVDGDVTVTTSYLTLGEQTQIKGDVVYTSEIDLSRAAGAIVSGAIVKNAVTVTVDQRALFRTEMITFLISLFATLSLYLLARKRIEVFGTSSTKRFPVKLLVGFATLFLVPIAVVILLASVLGIFVGLFALFAFCALFILTLPLMSIVLGSVVAELVTKKSRISVLWIIVGAALIHVLLLLPIVGLVALSLLFLVTLGNVVIMSYHVLR